jgi:histidinol-phosphate aminotransferase
MKVADYIRGLEAYVPGKPIDELEREYGIRDSVKLASNENPIGPSPKAVEAIARGLTDLHRYPDGYGFRLREKLCQRLGVMAEQIVFGNGSNEIIELLVRAFVTAGDHVVLPAPSFLMYQIIVQAAGARVTKVPLTEDLGLDLTAMAESVSDDTRLVFVNNPNNPTGTIISKNDFEKFLERIPREVMVVLDEAYIEFIRDTDCAFGIDYLRSPHTVVTLRTFSKAYGLAGLRLGYGVMPPEASDFVNRVRQPFNTNSLAQIGALAALDDDVFFQKTVKLVHEGIDFLTEEVAGMGLKCFPSQANFFLIDVQRDAKTVFHAMLSKGVIVRAMNAYGYPNYIRVNAGLPEENRRFLAALKEVIQE